MAKLTTSEAAKRKGLKTTGRIRQLIAEGRLPAEKLGRDWLIEEKDLEALELRPPGRPKKNE